MENEYSNLNSESNLNTNDSLICTPKAIHSLNGMSTWTLFFSILGFIGIGFMVILALVIPIFMDSTGMGNQMGMPMAALGIIYIVIAAIYFYPVLLLYQFSTRIRRSLQHKDPEQIGAALHRLMMHFKVVGILTIIFLAFYVIFLIFGIGMGSMGLW